MLWVGFQAFYTTNICSVDTPVKNHCSIFSREENLTFLARAETNTIKISKNVLNITNTGEIIRKRISNTFSYL
jgi:hypothetical protein